MRWALLAAPIGIGFGIFLGYLLWEGSNRNPSCPAAQLNISSPTVVNQAFEKEPADEGEAQPIIAPRPQLKKVEYSIFSEDLLNFFREGFISGWLESRPSKPDAQALALGEEKFREIVLLLPAKIAEVSAEEKTSTETLITSLAEGIGLDLISRVQKGEYTPDSNDLEWQAIDRCVEKRFAGPEMDGIDFSNNKEATLSAGMTVAFGCGVHSLDERRLRGPKDESFPSDVTIRGAGMDATLLRIGDISIRGDVERLTFQDLTLDAENDGLFDLRSGGLVLDLNHVRIVRFDAAHGGCKIFSVRNGCLIRARNCQIIGGYGRHPGQGKLFAHLSTMACFRNCHFELVRLSLNYAQPTGRVSFQGCTFTLLEENPMLEPIPNVDFLASSVESLIEPEMKEEDLQKDLSDLFWQLK